MGKILGVIMMLVCFAGVAWAHENEESGVYFVSPSDTSVHHGDIHVLMSVAGMSVHKAGDLHQGTGHFHIIVDGAFVPAGTAVKKDAQHIHFGKGQMETTLKLAKGEHVLTLQFADGHHVSYGENWSKTIHVQVK